VIADTQLAADEPLSPELVLVLPPALRAEAIARLQSVAGSTLRPAAPPAARATEATAGGASFGRALAALAAARLLQLATIFLAVSALTLVLSVVAQAVR
jgi:hypothetical protein